MVLIWLEWIELVKFFAFNFLLKTDPARLVWMLWLYTCTSRKYSKFYQQKGEKISDKSGCFFLLCETVSLTYLLLVSDGQKFLSFTLRNDGQCWGVDGVKETNEVDSSTMEVVTWQSKRVPLVSQPAYTSHHVATRLRSTYLCSFTCHSLASFLHTCHAQKKC